MPQEPIPTVLAVVVVRDGAPWLRRCLAALARQTHPKLGIVAVDNASTDRSAEILERLLGPRRVLRLRHDVGFPGAVGRVMRSPAARAADHLLLLHDDTFLAPTAVARMLAASVEEVGIVGAKVLDEERPVLHDVGGTIDRFGYPYTPLEEGEIDHGQYDSPRDVLAVSSAAMLVSREVWTRVGLPDERLRPSHADVDFCWRARNAGLRVVVEPAAVARHRAAGDRGERPGVPVHRGRYFDERANLTAILKNYRLFTLLWVFPLFLVQGFAKVVLFLLLRRFTEARQSLAGWGWALLQIPGTVRRRFRARGTRRLPDREVARLMVPVSERLRRWTGVVSGILFPGRTAAPLGEEEADLRPPLRARVGSLLSDQPATVALVTAVVVGLVAFRDVLFASPLEGGALPAFPRSAGDMLARFLDGTVPGGFGGSTGTSPAVGLLGLGSTITLGNPHILAWLLVAIAPFLAGAAAYRMLLRRTGERLGAVVAGVCYALSAVAMWAVSEGRLEAMVFLVGLPWLVGRLERPFDAPVRGRLAWVAGTGAGLGAVAAFFPAVWVPAALVVLLGLVLGGRGGRGVGLGLAAGAAGVAAVLIFPILRELARAGGLGLGETAVLPPFGSILRLSPGPAPGSWLPALFLPVAAVLGFAAGGRSRWTVRALLAGAAALPLAWLAGAGWLPGTAAEPVAFLGLAALSFSALAGSALGGLVETGSQSFGARQVLVGALALVVGGGVLLQATEAVRGEWSVGRDRVSPAYPVIETAQPEAAFRVLWIGSPDGGAFPAPGGLPQGVVHARAGPVRYGITGRHGRSVLSIGLPPAGPGYERLEGAIGTMLAGRVRHGGALLAPLGVGYIVAAADDLPAGVGERLDAQLDLLPAREAGGLRIYQNARAIPLAAVLPGATAPGAAASQDVLTAARIATGGAQPLEKIGPWTWAGPTALESPGLVYVSAEFDRAWRLEADGAGRAPFPAFGWAVGFEAPSGTAGITVSRPGGWRRPVEVAALAVLWAVALWLAFRRRPA